MINPSRNLDRTIGPVFGCAIENMLSIAGILCRLWADIGWRCTFRRFVVGAAAIREIPGRC